MERKKNEDKLTEPQRTTGHNQTAKLKPNQNPKRQEKKKKKEADRKCEGKK